MPDNGLKYAMALPLEPAVEAKIARLIKFADEHLDFFVKRWQLKGKSCRANTPKNCNRPSTVPA